MTERNRAVRLLLASLISCIVASACRPGGSTQTETPASDAGTTGGTGTLVTAAPAVPDLVVCTQFEPDRLLNSETEIGRTLEQLVVNPAVFYGNSYTAQAGHLLTLPTELDGTLKRNDDGTVSVTAHYRDGVLWSDGEPFKTSDVLLGLRAASSTSETQVMSATEGDALSVFLTLGEGAEYPYYPHSAPMPIHILGESDPSLILESDYSRIVNPSLGPYFVADWQAGKNIRFEVNPNYLPQPNFPAINVLIASDAQQVISMLASGQCQVSLDDLTGDQVSAASSAAPGSIQMQSRPSNIYDQLVFNTYPAPTGRLNFFGDDRIRQAVALAFDRSALATSAGLDASFILHSWLPDDHWAYSAANAANYPLDLSRASSLLDQAGWIDQDGNGVREYHGTGGDYGSCQRGEWVIDENTPFSVSLSYDSNNSVMALTAEQLRGSLSQIGIGVTVQPVEPSQFFDRSGPLVRRDFDMALIPALVYPDPGGVNLWVGEDVFMHPLEKTPVRRWQLEDRWLTSEQLVEWMAPNNIPNPANDFQGQNYAGWCDDGADSAVVQASRSLDLATRAGFYAEHQRLFNIAVPVIPLLLRSHTFAYSTLICGIDTGPVDQLTWNISSWRLDPTGACN